MTGTRIERMRILKEIRVSQGERVTLDQIDVELRHAKQYEKEDNLLIVKSLLDGGKSLNEIVNKMNLTKSTVARLIKLLVPRNPRQKNPLLPLRASYVQGEPEIHPLGGSCRLQGPLLA